MSAELVSILDAEGNAPRGVAPNLRPDALRRLFEVMLRTRLMSDHWRALRAAGRIDSGFVDTAAAGLEAVHIGTASALDDFDWVFPAARQPGVLLLRGVPFDEILGGWFGTVDDPGKGRQPPGQYSFRRANFVSMSALPATQLNQATGAAIAARVRGEDAAFLTFCTAAGTASNDFHAALNFAAVMKAPLVVVVESDLEPTAVDPAAGHGTAATTIAAKADAYGLPSVRVDGNDLLAMHRVGREAAERARRGDGSTLIEAVARPLPTTAADSPTTDDWRREDPIDRFRRYLQQKELWDEAFETACRDRALAELEAATERAAAAAAPTPASLFDDVFMNLSPQLREQRATLI